MVGFHPLIHCMTHCCPLQSVVFFSDDIFLVWEKYHVKFNEIYIIIIILIGKGSTLPKIWLAFTITAAKMLFFLPFSLKNCIFFFFLGFFSSFTAKERSFAFFLLFASRLLEMVLEKTFCISFIGNGLGA